MTNQWAFLDIYENFWLAGKMLSTNIKNILSYPLQKKKVLGQLKNQEKCFKICYVYGKRKPTQFFSFFIQSNFHFPLMNALVYVDIDQGIHKGKMKVALNEKRKKLRGFSFSINIANFEAFLSVFKLTKNPLFLKSE